MYWLLYMHLKFIVIKTVFWDYDKKSLGIGFLGTNHMMACGWRHKTRIGRAGKIPTWTRIPWYTQSQKSSRAQRNRAWKKASRVPGNQLFTRNDNGKKGSDLSKKKGQTTDTKGKHGRGSDQESVTKRGGIGVWLVWLVTENIEEICSNNNNNNNTNNNVL